MTVRAERVLFVHAHPDDETLATGSTIATLTAAGAQVTVLTCTRGELGEVIPDDLQHLTGAGLAAHREHELDAAMTALGVTDHRFLGQPGARWADRAPRRYLDSGMRWGKRGPIPVDRPDAGSLVAADVGEIAADIAAVLIATEPDVVVSYAADGGYGHPDHVRVHEATRTAAEVLHVPFYVIDSEGTRRGPVLVKPEIDAKRSALAAYRTQVSIDGDAFRLSSGDPRPIAAVESYTRLRPVGTSFGDHSLPARIAALLLAVVLGAFTGVMMTAAHQATVTFGTVTVPWGIIAALVISSALLVGLRLVFGTRLVAFCAAVGLIGVSALLATQLLGGSVIVPANPVGYTWTFAPVVISVLVLVWPRLVRRQPAVRQDDEQDRDIIEVPSAKGPDLP